MPPRMTVEGGFGGAGAGFAAAAGAALATALASAGVVAVVEVVTAGLTSAGLASAGLLVALAFAGLGEVAAAAGLFSIGGADFVPRPNIGDQAKPIRGAKFKLLSMLFWFSYRRPGEMVRCCRSFQSSCR